MLDSTQNLQVLCEAFRTYARKIAKKNDPRDPNFINISIACGKVSLRAHMVFSHMQILTMVAQIEQFIETIFPSQKPGAAPRSTKYANAMEEEKARQAASEQKWDMIYMGLAVLAVLFVVTSSMVCTPLSLSLNKSNIVPSSWWLGWRVRASISSTTSLSRGSSYRLRRRNKRRR